MDDDLGRTKNRLQESNKHIHALEDQAAKILGELELKATLVALRECVTRRHYEQAVAALGAELELKCTHTTVTTLQTKHQVCSL